MGPRVAAGCHLLAAGPASWERRTAELSAFLRAERGHRLCQRGSPAAA